MSDLSVTEIKAFVPAKDFALSKRFYTDLGFVQRSEGGGVAYFCVENCAFLLQDFYEEKLAENLAMHLLVPDVAAFPDHIYCDGAAQSEVVVPLVRADGSLLGVWDVDSHRLARFDEDDAHGMEMLCTAFMKALG